MFNSSIKGNNTRRSIVPFFFLLCTKSLHGIIKQVARRGETKVVCLFRPLKIDYLTLVN